MGFELGSKAGICYPKEAAVVCIVGGFATTAAEGQLCNWRKNSFK